MCLQIQFSRESFLQDITSIPNCEIYTLVLHVIETATTGLFILRAYLISSMLIPLLFAGRLEQITTLAY